MLTIIPSSPKNRDPELTMNLSLDANTKKLIEEHVKSGKFATPEEVVAAAIRALDQQEQFGDFEPGELDALLAESGQSIEQEGTLDGDEAFRRRRQDRARARDASDKREPVRRRFDAQLGP